MNFTKTAVSILLAAAVASANISIADKPFKDGAEVDYLIIAPAEERIFEQAQRLARWKWEKGLKTRIVVVDSILDNVQGDDDQHKIRNFLKYAWSTWDITWVLLLGDHDFIPARTVSTGGMYFPYTNEEAVSDVYYACLEGEWNTDGDDIFGNENSRTEFKLKCRYTKDGKYICDKIEPKIEGLDLWFDVYLGRLPASTGEEAKIMVDKIMHYRNTPRKKGYGDDMLMSCAQLHYLWTDYSRGISMDDASYYFFYKLRPIIQGKDSPFKNVRIDALFEDQMTEDGEIVNDSNVITNNHMTQTFSRGYNIVNFSFHGNPRGIRINSQLQENGFYAPDYSMDDVKDIESDNFSHFVSISCLVMKMPEGKKMNFAKSFLVNPKGGAVSFTGSSAIDYFNIRGTQYLKAAELMTKNSIKRLGRAYMLANALTSSRHNILVQQHWGDPELVLWTKSVEASDSFKIVVEKTNRRYQINVTPALDSVLVCAYKEGSVFKRSYTSNGIVEFDDIDAGISNLKITATKQDYLPGKVLMNTHGVTSAQRKVVAASRVLPAIKTAGTQVRIAFGAAHMPSRVVVFNALGSAIASYRDNEITSDLVLDNVPSGLFVIRSEINNQVFTQRFMIRK
ncbi:MAG: hypothetical protein GF398_17720 [Chitinivibrionales bacterium]|nr:hypothetical protein [Chitinivibrionales bacterium]